MPGIHERSRLTVPDQEERSSHHTNSRNTDDSTSSGRRVSLPSYSSDSWCSFYTNLLNQLLFLPYSFIPTTFTVIYPKNTCMYLIYSSSSCSAS